MTFEELIAIDVKDAAALARLRRENRDVDTSIHKAYYATFRRRIPGHCDGSIYGAFMSLKNPKLIQAMKELKEKKYPMRKGAYIHQFEEVRGITNANITDELARRILRAHPALISKFDNPPADWEREIYTGMEPKQAPEELSSFGTESFSEMREPIIEAPTRRRRD